MIKKNLLNVKTIGAGFAVLLLILIFFSNTIYTFNLPVATAVSPQKGSLNKIEIATGTVSYDLEYDIYSEIAGKVETLHVREGNEVKKGDLLITIDFGSSESDVSTELIKATHETNSKLIEIDISINKLNVDIDKMKVGIEKIQLNIENTERKIEELKKEDYTNDSASRYEISQCESDIAKAEDTYDKMKTLYEAGAVSLSELNNAKNSLQSLYDKLERLNETKTEQAADKDDSRQKQIKDLEYQLNTYYKDLDSSQKDLNSKQLDLQNYANQKQKSGQDLNYKSSELNKTLQDYRNNTYIYAQEDGIITSVSVNEGQYVGVNQKMLSFGREGDLVLLCNVASDNSFISAGDICALGNASHTLEGTVVNITPVENAKEITVAIKPDGISSGETFDVRFEKESSETFTLVPKGALNMDSDGYYLNKIKRRDGILGKEFYTEKLRVYIGDSDNENAAVIKGIDFFEPVVLISDKAFNEGDTIKLKNESDFFE